MKKLKVLHVLKEIKFSGAELMLNIAAQEFSARNIELHALALGQQRGDYADILQSSGYQIHHIPFSYSVSFWNKFTKLLKAEKFDVVHVHPEKECFYISAICKYARVKKVVATIHNVFGIIHKKPVLRKMRWKRYIARNFFGLQYLSIGQSVQETEEEILKNPTILIPNWIDESKFYASQDNQEKLTIRKEFNIPEKAFVLISVGACSHVKNQKDILQAMPKILEQVPHAIYILVGDGPKKAEYEQLALDLGIKEQVYFWGQTERVRDVLVASDVFVMPSKFEGLGNSLLESLYCEIPAVVYNVYGLKDLIINERNGFIGKCEPEFLTQKIMFLAKHPDIILQMGNQASKIAKEEYNLKKSIDRLYKVYTSK